MTEAEQVLWPLLRMRRVSGYKFRRQHPIGPYVVDFVCLETRLVIELDGAPHLESVDYDRQRDAYLSQLGYKVLRFWDNQALADVDNVLKAVEQTLSQQLASRYPSSKR